MLDVYDVIGLVGVFLAIYAYARVQWHRDYAKEISYSLANGVASVLMLISLSSKWNLASFVGNIIWLSFSAYGMYRCFKYVRRNRSIVEG